MASYCTLAQARTAGAVGTDPEVTAAIAEASDRVDLFTRTVFDARPLTVETDAAANGYARLPLPILTVDSVTFVGVGAAVFPALEGTSYTISRATRPGDTDSIQLAGGGYGFGLDTVVGMESYRRHDRGPIARRLAVTGTFGREAVPSSVARATALLAASLTGGGGGSAVNVEGDVDLPPRVPSIGGAGTDDGLPTTGVPAADSLLRVYRRVGPRIS